MDARARDHLIQAGKDYPGAWKQYDAFRQDRGVNLPDWPDWCYAPLAAAHAIVTSGLGRVSVQNGAEVGRLGALAAWRPTQGVYRFDETLFEDLSRTPITGELPCDVLYRLPEWCVYLETPGMWFGQYDLHGAFVHLEYDANNGRGELRLLLDTGIGLVPVPIHIGEWSLAEALSRMLDTSRVWGATVGVSIPADTRAVLQPIVEPIVSLVLYLCSENAEIGGEGRRPSRPRPKRTKQGWRLFPAKRVEKWDVGVRLGAALKRAVKEASEPVLEDSGRSRPRGHVRRAHWHTYWRGPERSERTLKWLPPIPVNLESLEDLPSTVRPVRPAEGSNQR